MVHPVHIALGVIELFVPSSEVTFAMKGCVSGGDELVVVLEGSEIVEVCSVPIPGKSDPLIVLESVGKLESPDVKFADIEAERLAEDEKFTVSRQ